MVATPQMLPDSSHQQGDENKHQPFLMTNSPNQWQLDLKNAIRETSELLRRLKIEKVSGVDQESRFPCLVTESFLRRMTPGDVSDPLLRQVMPSAEEQVKKSGFVNDPVGDLQAEQANGLLQKYHGRALLVLNGNCAIHCRYCFRREYPYVAGPKSLQDWEPAFQQIESDSTLREVILSGGDPLMVSDERLHTIVTRIAKIPHIQRLRIHSRLPVVLPSRITQELISVLQSSSLQPVFVIHANHAAELVDDCASALKALVQSGIPTLNQAVLLKRVNDDPETLLKLCERSVNLGVMPYYLHQLDRVAGAAHFEVAEEIGHQIMRYLRERLPGYAVPKFVREIPGEASKTLLPRM